MADKVRKLKDKAVRHMNKGRHEEALEAYLEVVRLEPHDLPSRQKVGDLFRKLGDTRKAIAAYQAVAGAYAADGLLLKAIAISKVILLVDPDHTETQKALADLYARKRGRTRSAEMPAAMSVAVAGGGLQSASTIRGRPTARVIFVDQEDEVEQREEADEAEVIELLPSARKQAEPETVSEIEIVDEIEFEEEGEDGDEEEEILFEVDVVDELDAAAIEEEVTPHTVDLAELPPIPLFSDLPKNAFIKLLERITLHHFEDGEVVLVEGDTGDSFFVVASGKVRVVKERGRKKRIDLAVLGEGSFFGEMALLGDGERHATVISQGSSELLEVSEGMLKEVTKDFPSVKKVMSRFYRQRLLSNLIKTSPIFSQLDSPSRKELIEKFKSRELPRGTKILTEGQRGDGLYVMLSGRCEVSRKTDGKRRVLGELKEGDVFGEMSLMTREPVAATVKAIRKCLVLRLPAKTFTEVIMWHPQILELVSTLSDVRASTNDQFADDPSTDHEQIRV